MSAPSVHTHTHTQKQQLVRAPRHIYEAAHVSDFQLKPSYKNVLEGEA